MPYDLEPANTPRLTGLPLAISAALVEGRLTGALLGPKLMKDAGVLSFRAARLEEPPSVRPPIERIGRIRDEGGGPAPDIEALCATAPPQKGFAFERVADFARAYGEGRTTPEEVARRLVDAVRASDADSPPLRAIVAMDEGDVFSQARASADRWRRGQPLSPLDGVPVAVKDEFDCLPYPTTVGTRFLKDVPRQDATVVARLRAAGALIIGKANMYEIGIDPRGFNVHHGTARNPYDPQHDTGGSSSGPGAAVAAGLCPLALGADGGGSIRIPAALCGVVGLKATWGRVSEAGSYPLAWSVGHAGPIAATARDCAIGYALLAGEDPRDAATLGQPAHHLDGLGNADLAGLRIGLYTPWFEDADAEMVAACGRLVADLESRGARRVEVEVPDLELARVAHGVTILSEMATAMDPYYGEHRTDFGHPVRVALGLARKLTSRDYVHAQRARTRLSRHFDRLFEACDVLVTPTTGITAPRYLPDAFPRGESNLVVTSALMRFVFPANLTGTPAVSVPAGYDANGLPIGLQIMGRAWEEHLCLRLAEVAEAAVERRAPKLHFRLLPA